MKKELKLIVVLTMLFLLFGFISCPSGAGNNANNENNTNNTNNNNNANIPTSIKSERLILEAVDNGIKITVKGETGWGDNTWIDDLTSNIQIFVTNFENENKFTFVYPFTENGKSYKFDLYNQSVGTDNYRSETYEIKATGGAGYPMSDAFTQMTVEPSRNSAGEYLVKFNTTAEKLSDFFRVDISLLTNNKVCNPALCAGILFGYPGICSQVSYSNVYLYFDSADGDCVSGQYNLKDCRRVTNSNLFELMKTHSFETWVFRDDADIANYENLYFARPEMQIYSYDSDINYWIRGNRSEKKTLN